MNERIKTVSQKEITYPIVYKNTLKFHAYLFLSRFAAKFTYKCQIGFFEILDTAIIIQMFVCTILGLKR